MKSKWLFRLTSAVVLIGMISAMFTGCSDDADVMLKIPDEVIEGLKSESESTVTPVIHFYFNNTAHTQGFFSKKLALENGKYERGIYDDNAQINTVSFVNAIENSFDGRYDTKEYSIGCKNNSTDWAWVENAGVYGDCGKSDFYMTRDIDEKNQMRSVLDSFPADDSQKPTINVYLSSLAELNQNMSDLTEWVRSKVNGHEDYSVCVLCALCDYNGKIYPIDSAEALDNKELTGKKPLYLIMTGPTSELDSYVDTLRSALKSAKFEENADFSVYFFPEKELTRIKSVNDEVVVPSSIEDRGDLNPETMNQLLDSGIFNVNLNAESIPQTEYGDVFEGVDDYLDLYAFRYTEAFKKAGRMVINMYVPLYECNDANESLYDCYFYDKLDGNETAEIDRLLKDNSSLKIYRYDLTVEENEDEESEDEAEELRVVEAKEIIPYELEKLGFDITTTVIDGGEVPSCVFTTSVDEDTAEEIEGMYAAKLTADHKWLKLTVEYKYDPGVADKRASIMLNIPVYAVLESTFPAWFEDCSYASKDYSNTDADILAKTCDFVDFMNIIADKEIESEELYRARYENKIADIAVCITDIPVAG